MTTAKIAFQAMQNMAQELADLNKAEMEEAPADSPEYFEAMGAYSAYRAMHRKFAELSAAGFEPDELDIVTTKLELTKQYAEDAQRSLRLRQNTARARDLYIEFWQQVQSYRPGKTDFEIGDAHPALSYAYLTMGLFNAIAQEWTPEQEAETEAVFEHLSKFLEAVRVWARDSRPTDNTLLQ